MASSIGGGGAFITGTQAVASAGTAEALTALGNASQWTSVTLVAYDDNTGRIFYGGADVDSSTQKGLAPGDTVTVSSAPHSIDLDDFYVDAAVSGEGVDFIGAN